MDERTPPGPRGTHRRARRVRARLLALSATLLATAITGEVLVRLRVGSPWREREPLMNVRANPQRGWEMVPGEHYTYHNAVHVNSLGLRGREVEPKQPDELRVLALGDSLVYGQGVADDETLPAYVEELLRDRLGGRPVTVINGGHRAYATHQELALARELGEALAPDELLVFWFWNDLTEHDPAELYERLRARGPIAFDVGGPMRGATRLKWRMTQVLRRSALLMWIHDVWAGRATAELGGIRPMGLDLYAGRFEGHVRGFVALAHGLGCRLRFATIPVPVSLTGPHASLEAEARVRSILSREGVEIIDLRAPLEAWVREHGELPVIPFDGHYLPVANRVMAAAVVMAL